MLTKKISSDTGNGALDLALDTIKVGKQGLVFVNTKMKEDRRRYFKRFKKVRSQGHGTYSSA
jgi:replicative superfamily II helicase